jgi:hypothetical protein
MRWRFKHVLAAVFVALGFSQASCNDDSKIQFKEFVIGSRAGDILTKYKFVRGPIGPILFNGEIIMSGAIEAASLKDWGGTMNITLSTRPEDNDLRVSGWEVHQKLDDATWKIEYENLKSSNGEPVIEEFEGFHYYLWGYGNFKVIGNKYFSGNLNKEVTDNKITLACSKPCLAVKRGDTGGYTFLSGFSKQKQTAY